MTQMKLKNFFQSSGILLGLVATVAHAEESTALKFNALLQTWAVADTSITDANPNFRIRRAEFKASGEVNPSLKWNLMIDPAKAISGDAGKDNKILQDLGITYTIAEGLEVSMGQFKLRTTAEGLASSSELPLPERSVIGRYFGDKREPGLLLNYKMGAFGAAVMVSNGQSTNNDDVDGKKDLSARLDYEIVEGLSLGLFTLAQNFSYSDLARYGFNVNYKNGPLTARGEAAYQDDTNGQGYGWMIDLAYNLDTIEPVIRYEQLKPRDSIDVAGIVGSVGLNYYLEGKKNKFQLAYSYLKNIAAPNGTPDASSIADGVDGNVFYLVFQAAL